MTMALCMCVAFTIHIMCVFFKSISLCVKTFHFYSVCEMLYNS